MKPVHQSVVQLIKLILRSPPAEPDSGWRTVSPLLRATVQTTAALCPELFQLELDHTPARVRLSPDGEVLARYL